MNGQRSLLLDPDTDITQTRTSPAISLPILAAGDRGRSSGDDDILVDFVLPPSLEAGEPPEARGLARDDVRLMVSHYSDDRVLHMRFRDLPAVLEAGDVLVINTSGTMNAALSARRVDGTPLELHLSTQLPADLWVVEPRQPQGTPAIRPLHGATPGEVLALPSGAAAT